MEEGVKKNDQIRESISRTRLAYNNIADQYDDLFTPFQEAVMYPRIAALLESLVGKLNGKKILDLGCGTGAFAAKLKKRGVTVFGIDISSRLLDFAKLRGVKAVEGSIHELPFVNESFDAVISNFVLHYFSADGQARVLQESIRVLRVGGALVFSCMHPSLMRLGRYRQDPPHYRPAILSYYEPQKEEVINSHGQTFTLYLRDLPEIVNSVLDSGFTISRILDADFPENLDEVLARVLNESSRRFIQNFRYDPYAIFIAAIKAV